MVGTGNRIIRCHLQFLPSDQYYDRFFVYKAFARIKRTTVKLLSMPEGGDMDDFVFKAKEHSKIAEGIGSYYSFAFPQEGRVQCALSSIALEQRVDIVDAEIAPQI